MDWNGSGRLGSIERFSSKYKRVCFIKLGLDDVSTFRIPRSLSAWKDRAAQSTGGPTFQSIHQKLLFQRWLFNTVVRERNENMNLTQAVCSWNNARHAALSIFHSITSRLQQTTKKRKADLFGILSGFPRFSRHYIPGHLCN